MKVLILCLFVASAAAWPHWASDAPADSLAHRQQDVNHLLFKVTEPLRARFTHLKDASLHFDPEADTSMYKDDGVAAHHLMDEIRDHRVLAQKHWFSLFNTRQREEALMLFEVLYNCKTWVCAASNAAFFREKMNEGIFVYALYVAVTHHELGHGIVLPPLYEVTPHMFTNSEIINKAYTAKMTQIPGNFKMAFTGSKKNPEQRVAYFGEDIGMNVHHVTWHMDFPFWWQDKYGHHIDRKGELFFWVHHQLTVRFDSERLSNNLGMVDELYWDKPIVEGFAPHTTYRYGGEFPARPDNIRFSDVDGVARIRDMMIYESRIRDAIAHGYFTGHDGNVINIKNEHGIDVLGDVIESSMYSPNVEYYGALHNLAHIVLGSQADPHGKYNMPPGVMEHFETATRDPSFFRLHKYMDNIFKEHKDSLPPYTAEDFKFEGVEIKDVKHGAFETFFEDFKFDLTNAVDDTEEVAEVPLTATVSRLNHKPFDLEIDIDNNGADHLATFRVFLCPYEDSNHIKFTFDEGRWHCIEMDKFWRTLSSGSNHIVRHSHDSSVTVPDRPCFHDLMEKADAAVADGSELDLHEFERACGLPNRALLPKGTHEGMKFWLAVTVTDGAHDAAIKNMDKDEHGGTHSQCGIHGETYPDKRPLGFPYDRRIPDERIIINSHIFKSQVVKVYHRDAHHG